MSEQSPVILQQLSSGATTTLPRSRPDTMYVLSYRNGGLRAYASAPSLGDRVGSRYCYIVDVSERHTSGKLRVPAMGDVFFFSVDYDATWYVTDPTVVVRRRMADGDGLVAGFLRDTLWRLGRSFDSSEVQLAEHEMCRAVQPPVNLGNGLTMTGVSIRLGLDKRQFKAATEMHEDVHIGRLERNRMTRLKELVDGDDSYLLLHLAHHPGDTGAVLDLLRTTRERNDDMRLGLLDRMLKHDFVQDADMARLRDHVLGGHAAGPAAALPAGSHAGAQPPSAPSTWDYIDAAGQTTSGPGQGGPAPDPDGGTRPEPVAQPAPDDNVTTWRPVGSGRRGRGRT